MGSISGDLISPVIKPTNDVICFSFYYYMFGPVEKVTLALIIPGGDGPNTGNYIWFKADSHNDMWHRKFITIFKQKSPFFVSNLIKMSHN